MVKGVFFGFNRIGVYQIYAEFINKGIRHYHNSNQILAKEAKISVKTLRKMRKADPNVKLQTYFAVITVLAIALGYCKEDLAKELGIDKDKEKFFL